MDHLSKKVSEQVETLMTEIIKELDRVSEQLDVHQGEKGSADEVQNLRESVQETLDEPSTGTEFDQTEYELDEEAYAEENEDVEDVDEDYEDYTQP